MTTPQKIIDFWTDAGPGKWWAKDDQLDKEIFQKFGSVYQQACNGELDNWENEPNSALALILLLDQFSRNLNRNSPLAFAQDEKCVNIVTRLLKAGTDRKMPEHIVEFCYLPLMHSELLVNQKICLKEMQRIDKQGCIKAAIEHLEIIEKFGRFPHRNAVLERTSTQEELKFLEDGGFAG